MVGDRGYRLSGGEKQRLAIARLLLKDPAVMILDEATSHLDNDNEATCRLRSSTRSFGRTALVIAHRLSTIRYADRIAVLDGGRIVELGTHDELVALDGRYAAQLRAGTSESIIIDPLLDPIADDTTDPERIDEVNGDPVSNDPTDPERIHEGNGDPVAIDVIDVDPVPR